MPIPVPRSNEDKDGFISRCMSDSVMSSEYDEKQRSAICYRKWQQKNASRYILSAEVDKQRFKVPFIHTGKYVHPNDNWELNVDTNQLNSWLNSFEDMKSNGVRVPVTRSHSFENDISNIMGYVQDMEIEDDWLIGTVEFRGSDNIELAQIVEQASVGIERDFKDGIGNNYEEVIQHVAITSTPVVPNQGGFRIAASLESKNYIVLKLANNKEGTMNKEFCAQMSELLGCEVTKENAAEVISARFEALQDAREDNVALNKKLALATKQVEEFKSMNLPPVDPETLEDRAMLYEEQFNSLVENAQLTPEGATAFKSLCIGDKENRCRLALTTHGGRQHPWVREIIQILKNEPPRVEFGSRTKQQLSLVPDRLKDERFDVERHNRMRQFAGLAGLGGK